MILLDTTVLVYAVGQDHPLRTPARRLFEAIRDGRVRASTSVEVIQEFVHVRTRRRSREDAVGLARDFVGLLSPLVAADEDTLELALQLYAETPDLGAFDSVLAALGRQLQAGLVSAARGFAVVPGLTHHVPDADGVERLLRRT